MIAVLLEIGLQNVGFEKSSHLDGQVGDAYVLIVIHKNSNEFKWLRKLPSITTELIKA
jgi:hypothetical protein